MSLPRDFAQQVKAAADIVRIVGESVRLKRAGNSWTGLCPFHQEKTPSFSVSQAKQFYYCFGCGAKGDVFTFVQETERVDFPEALRRVASRSGIPIPADVPRQPESPEEKQRGKLYELHDRGAAFFRQQLQTAEAAPVRELIRQRGVTEESVEEFGLGYAPGQQGGSRSPLADVLRKEGFDPALLAESGLVIRRDDGGMHDRFRHRWVFPIANESGRIVAFGARALGDDQPKYLNSPETPIYSKGRVLYNLARAREAIRKAGSAVLVEGYMDAIAAHQAGVANVVASCGTALTAQQVKLVARSATEVVMSYDPDIAGASATDRSLALLLEENLAVRIVALPDNLDPDQFVKQRGAEAYRAAVAGAALFFRYLATRALALHGKSSPEAKLAAVNFVLPYLSKVPNALIRSELMADIAQKLDVNKGVIGDSFQKATLARRESLPAGWNPNGPGAGQGGPARNLNSAGGNPASLSNAGGAGEAGRRSALLPAGSARLPAAETMLIRLLLEDAEARAQVLEQLHEQQLVEEMEASAIVLEIMAILDSGEHREGEHMDYARLAKKLDPRHERILAEIAFDPEARPVSLEEVSSYLNALKRKRLLKERQQLLQQIKECQEQAGGRRILDLLQARLQLDRKLAELV